MAQLKGAQVICEALLREGADIVFGYPGGAVLPLYDALWGYPGIRHILARHEQGAVHAADAFARASGRTGVCFATSGPGATNLITGLLGAKMDSVPVVAITGQVVRPTIGREAFQECATTAIAGPATKAAFLVTDVKDLAPTLRKAFAIARAGRPGPVLVDVPRDVQQEMVEFSYPEVRMPARPVLDAAALAAIDRLADLVSRAQRPLFLVGRGVQLSAADRAVVALAEKAQVPVVTTLHANGTFPRRHPLSLGLVGMHGMFWSNMAMHHADLVVGLGARFDDRVVGRVADFVPNGRVVHVDIEREQIGKLVTPHLSVVGDVGAVVETLLRRVPAASHDPWLGQIAAWRREHPSLGLPDTQALPVQYVMSRLNEIIGSDADAIVVTGVGQHQMWAAQFLEMGRPRSFLSSGGLGVMGYEVPGALGAQVARPGATVWGICGDGGFQMTSHELATIVEERLPVKLLVMRNGYLGMVRQWQELFYEKHIMSVPISGPDLVRLAEAYGMRGLRVTGRGDVDEALRTARRHDGPILVDCVVEPADNVYPMVPPGASLGEMVEDPAAQPHAAPTLPAAR